MTLLLALVLVKYSKANTPWNKSMSSPSFIFNPFSSASAKNGVTFPYTQSKAQQAVFRTWFNISSGHGRDSSFNPALVELTIKSYSSGTKVSQVEDLILWSSKKASFPLLLFRTVTSILLC
jgi:hypothetical protein